MVFIVQNRLRAQNICHPSLTKGELLCAGLWLGSDDQQATELENRPETEMEPVGSLDWCLVERLVPFEALVNDQRVRGGIYLLAIWQGISESGTFEAKFANKELQFEAPTYLWPVGNWSTRSNLKCKSWMAFSKWHLSYGRISTMTTAFGR